VVVNLVLESELGARTKRLAPIGPSLAHLINFE
jgi:hypothetical protein